MPKVGRPRKSKSEKIEYQLIAVHAKDYRKFINKAESANVKKVRAFHEMVENYNFNSKSIEPIDNAQ